MCVSEDVGCLCPNHIKAYLSCGFWFALALSLIHQGKQCMRKCVAYSFRCGSLMLWVQVGYIVRVRLVQTELYTCLMCVFVYSCALTGAILQAFFSSRPRVRIKNEVRNELLFIRFVPGVKRPSREELN